MTKSESFNEAMKSMKIKGATTRANAINFALEFKKRGINVDEQTKL